MRYILPIIFALSTLSIAAQMAESVGRFDGIWIAKNFHESFDSTRSIVESKDAFDFSYPVALRINHKEVFGEKLNVGFSVLHDHLLYPEVSQFEIVNSDTIWEQNHFTFELSQFAVGKDIQVSEIYSFGYLCQSFLTFNDDNSITLRRTDCERERDEPEKIEFVRFTSQFELLNPFPNPLYNYTRALTVAGNYTLLDSSYSVVATDFRISTDGKLLGFSEFEGQTFHYSTDIYCGPPTNHVYVFMCENISDPFGKYDGFSMIRKANGDIEWYKRTWSEPEPFQSPKSLLGTKMYELKRN